MAGKGDKTRPFDKKVWDENYERIFRRKEFVECPAYEACSHDEASVSDGFGSVWSKCKKKLCGLHVVRPGKVQCCEDDCWQGRN